MIFSDPLVKVAIEVVQGDMSSGEEDLLNTRIDSL